MVISQPPGNNPSYYYQSTNASLHLFECFQRHLMFYTCNYNIRVTHRNGAIGTFFTRIRSTEGSSADCSLFILSLHALALHLAVKILLQIFLYEDLSDCWPYIHLSVVFPSRMPAGPHFVTQPILLSENIFNILYKSSTKHKEVRPDWMIKTTMQTTRPRITHVVVPQWLRLPFLATFDHAKRFRSGIVLFWTKRHNVSHYIYYLATDNIHRVRKR